MLQTRYKIGLIDEFQDTNAAQFDIFRLLFLENPESTFIVVGDPRQAIYRFRNCDLDTYRRAVESMKARGARVFPMNLNRRSGEKYIQALNAIFSPRGSFALEGMDMPEQSALPGSQVLLDSKLNEAAFPIQVVNEKIGLDAMLRRCASDIAGFLGAGYRIPPRKDDKGKIVEPDRPLESGDIAVLLGTTWKNGRALRDELLKLGVPAVVLKGENIFGTPEAEEMVRFLEGVLDPEDHDARLRALITPLGNMDASRLGRTEETAVGVSRLRELGEIWHRHSFGVMYSALDRTFRPGARSDSPERRRKTGRYDAIADVLAEEEFSRKLTPNALFCELCRYVEEAKKNPDAEAFPAPPETDRGAVVIDTVFGSKGLSYPVVFLPDLFWCQNRSKSPCRCHDANGQQLLMPMLPSDIASKLGDEVRELIRRENDELIQESLRKAYVAFTRAKYFCRFYCGVVAEKDDPPRHAATDWLFRRPPEFSFSGLEEQMENHFLPEPEFPAVLGRPEAPSTLTGEAAASKPGELRRPDLLPDPGFSRSFLSFSNLSENGHERESSFAPENDDEKSPDGDGEMEEIQQFRGGAAFGSAIHKLLEQVDFTLGREQLELAAAQPLASAGFGGEEMKKLAGRMLWNTFNSPLPDGLGGDFRLSAVDPARRISEFEFLCEFDTPFGSSELFDTVSAYFTGRTGCREAAFSGGNELFTRGFFNGSIDLFFEHDSRCYIVDWKTNQLKDRDYSAPALAGVMGQSGYCLPSIAAYISLSFASGGVV